MVQPGDLIPFAQIPYGLKSVHRLQAFWYARTTVEQQGHKEPYCCCHLLHVIDLLPLPQGRGNMRMAPWIPDLKVITLRPSFLRAIKRLLAI
jgi:hypothetical protein